MFLSLGARASACAPSLLLSAARAAAPALPALAPRAPPAAAALAAGARAAAAALARGGGAPAPLALKGPNTREPRTNNHGARPCSSVRRRRKYKTRVNEHPFIPLSKQKQKKGCDFVAA